MTDFLIYIYQLFRRRKIVFLISASMITLAILYLALQIGFDEDITRSTGSGDINDNTGVVVKNLNISDKLIVDMTLTDSLSPASPDDLVALGMQFTDSLRARFDTSYIRSVSFRASDTVMSALTDLVMRHLPVFFDAEDYAALDTLLLPGSISQALKNNYKILASPASMVLKKRIQADPLGISNIAFAKLKSLRANDNFELYDGCVFTGDRRHLLIFIQPANPSGETSRNDHLILGLDQIISNLRKSQQVPSFKIQYFGGTAVAVCNARQLKRDISLTIAIAVALILLLVGWYFKSIKVPVLGMLPALFGGALALAILFLARGKISAISLGLGSVILGLIVDYSLYLVNHFRTKQDIILTLKEMSLTIVLCSLTTAGAFLCLPFLGSAVLQDLGWFAAISVLGAALFTLVILPQLTGTKLLPLHTVRVTGIDRLAAIPYEKQRFLIIGLLLTAILSAWFSRKVEFEKNMSALSFVTPELAKAEEDLDKISNYKLKNIYLVATGKTTEEALQMHERLDQKVRLLVERNIIQGISNAGPLLASDSLQQLKIARWNRYWTPDKKHQLKENLVRQSEEAGFRSSAFDTFLNQVEVDYKPLTIAELEASNNPLIADWISVKDSFTLAPTILRVSGANVDAVYREFPKNPGYVLFDRQKLTERFVENVKHDFDLLVTLSMVFVTILLVVSFGRLGLGLMTAMPMFLSWLITLGFMGVTGIRFNIFNIIISSFIFGLGVDYSILMMRGLQHTLKFGRENLHTYKVSVLLSALTTLIGVAALFLARHPALNSIALVSVVGIVNVVLLSFVFQPLIFQGVILGRSRRKQFPVTFRILIKTVVTWGNIVAIALILMILGTMINFLLPVRRKKKELIFHYMFYWLTRAYIAFTFAFDRKLINEQGEDFTKPAIIISNHQSLIETPAFLRLYPKIIILTTSWVYRSPIFGPIARLANFYNVDDGIDSIIGLLEEKVKEGFSILIFPEAHRSADQHIQRFHRGAFYLAEKLKIDILPVMVFGTGDFLGKGAFWGRPNSFRMKILERVGYEDISFGSTYQERARQFRKFYITNYAGFKASEGNTHYYRRLLALNYVLKGPVLEWYMRVKLKLENNYEIYHQLMPRHGDILDLGCGYGFISYMLMFTSDHRTITGVDYDAEKIGVAENCFSKNSRISFVAADVSSYDITPKNGFLLSDVLHYLEPALQDELLRKCCRNLLPGGTILIREANSDLTERHRKSMFTEFFSTRSGFNKTSKPGKELYFTSASHIAAIATEQGLLMKIMDYKKVTSNNFFVLRKKLEE